MNANLAPALAFAFREEGGYVVDSGGPTNLGITQATLATWRKHPVTVHDVQTLTRAEATAIYTVMYWHPCGCDGLPPGLDLMVFDEAVNAGIYESGVLLQHILGITEDGDIGPVTLRAAECYGQVLRTRIANLGQAQLARYHTLPTFPKYGRGWTARVTARQAAAMALTIHSLPIPHPVGA